MSENQNIIGERWTKQSITFLTSLGWTQLGCANFDSLPCIHHPARKGQGHGIDSLFQFYDPYLGKTVQVIVESKYRKWEGMQTSNLRSFIKQVIESLECAPDSVQLRELQATGVYTGLILCWCNDGKYNHEKHKERIAKIMFRNKNFPFQIFFASNREMLQWYSVDCEMKSLIEKKWDVDYYYPSINYKDRTNIYLGKHLTLLHMFSKYIFAQSTRTETFKNSSTGPITSSIIFSLDDVSLDSLNLLYNVCKQYQMQRTDELIIYLHANETEVHPITEHFLRDIKSDNNNDNKKVEIIIRYLANYEGIVDLPTIY